MIPSLHCTHLLFLAHAASHQDRRETLKNCPSMAPPQSDHVADEDELKRRRQGEAQPQLVPAEMIRDRDRQEASRRDVMAEERRIGHFESREALAGLRQDSV
ncbi:hypothetical protein GQ602_003401 [Ophiocordyceps camponoti-floridani]|uniref:Uncharacterized protein n=1 Tax=Ophiocordyceps camponoti-floridani TaxID=2030778 RepID=A0A8H4Q854_9HYPO|nr:hypothetical protein GQ602_003401 [Ophiocordyceps camponoti-floridani]